MQAGRLRHQIIIQQQSSTQDTHGQLVETWSTFATVRASVEPLRGREYFGAEQEQAEVSTRIRIRYIAGVLPKMRVLFGSKLYDIVSVINAEERNFHMELMCNENLYERRIVTFSGETVTFGGEIVVF